MPIVQQGSLNTTALVVPDLYVQIVPPSILALNGTPSNVIGVVGTASWGPANQPVVLGTMAQYAAAFGAVMPRKYDMGTQVATAVQQGAQAFYGVRVTDGTDTAATATLAGANLAARYTGSLGNSLAVSIGAGSAAGSRKVVLALPGLLPETYDNLPSTSGAAFWAALVAAINTGAGPLRGPSALAVATIGSNTSAVPTTLAATAFSGGTDGATGVTAETLVGQDGLARTGMYALRSLGCSIGVLADSDDPTTWTTQAAFGLSEGLYMILTGPSGDTIADTIAVKQSAGLDSYGAKLMFGDWLYWYDQTNALTRLVSPQGFVAGRLGNLSPEQSSLNKPLYSVIGSQKSGLVGSGQSTAYSSAELQTLFQAGIDVVSNPQPGGAYWGVRCGHNSSSNAAINGDNYTRMTNYIASTLNAGMGTYVGQVITTALFNEIEATEDNFLTNMQTQGMIGSTDGTVPFKVTCNLSNNPKSRTSLGYVQSDAQVNYLGINEKFLVNLQGGVTVTPQSTGVTIGGAGT